ncbi:MAG: DUF302 domain-containing protein [Acidimicrobiales bacterium]|jgi:uncharacterized protein (DUF302 family)
MTNTDRAGDEFGVITKISSRSVSDTTSRLLAILASKGVVLFAVIDQREEARAVGLELRETTLVIFGSPKAGTPVMVASPLSALDLPLKLLIWADGAETKVSYYSPAYLAERHHLSNELESNLASIDVLSDALIAD